MCCRECDQSAATISVTSEDDALSDVLNAMKVWANQNLYTAPKVPLPCALSKAFK